jgi:excisionase family DNA binding protein
MLKMYEAIIEPEEGIGYSVEFPDIPCSTQGETLEEAYEMAYDALGLMLEELSESGKGYPMATFGRKAPDGGIVAVFAVDTSQSFTEKYVTVKQACDMLRVSHARVQALIKSGDIISEKVGTARMIDQRSVIDYRSRRQGAGRPKNPVAL